MINRDTLVPGRRRDPSERPGHARDVSPQQVGTVRMGSDARDRSLHTRVRLGQRYDAEKSRMS
eukprot:2538907-Prymnesium_polylepis.1